MIIGDAPAAVDHTLLRNLAIARKWLAALKKGRSHDGIDAPENVATSSVKQMITLAFSRPTSWRASADGTQPIGLTTKWLMTHELPICWKEQRRLVAAL